MDTVNIKKLAKELNLSAATVSRALRDSHEISIETKRRVRDLAQKLNYEPNPSASNLRSNKAKTIAVILPEVANNFFSQAIKGIEEIARPRGCHVLIYQTHENSETETAFINGLLNGRVDGILISVSNNLHDTAYFNRLVKKIPVVFFDRIFGEIDAVRLITDDYESAYSATQHLIECGCKQIAFLAALDHLLTGINRKAGYQDALKNNGLTFDQQLIVTYSYDDGRRNHEAVKNLILRQKPDGIVTSIEELALPCYYICRELKIDIPADLKIISFSNLNTAPLLNPSLTTITQPAYEMGKSAAGVLFKIIDKKFFEPAETLVLKSVLVKRDSTSCL